jgi:hypothetical protein
MSQAGYDDQEQVMSRKTRDPFVAFVLKSPMS